ncbi:hypothetical protein ID866_3465 [Astraeus odoratus]|nr:hypothetical protein ID866_3465 [Astraeus odoratus]
MSTILPNGLPSLETEIELLFLGTGTSSSVPHLECLTAPPEKKPCNTCLSTLTPEGKKNIRRNTSVALRFTGKHRKRTTIVIDVGKNFQAAAVEWFPKYGLREIDAVVLTHAHADGWTLGKAIQEHIDVYVSQDTFREVQRAFPYLVSKEFASGGGDVPDFKWHIIEDKIPFEVKDTGVWLTPFLVQHGRLFTNNPVPLFTPTPNTTQPTTPVESGRSSPRAVGTSPAKIQPYWCFGFIIQSSIIYMSDVSFIPHDAWGIIESGKRRPTLVVVDCLRLRGHTSHMGVREAAATIRRIDAQRSYLIGFSHDLLHDEWVAIGEAAGQERIDRSGVSKSSRTDVRAVNVAVKQGSLAMKFFSQSFLYDDPWSIVSLAFFLRYPNPYAAHVVSCDVVDRQQTESGTLLTTRLILKRGALPRWAPKGIMSRAESWVIEESEVDPYGKVMRCRTKNLDHVKVMQVEETQLFEQTPEGRALQTTEAYITSKFGWGLTKRIESHGLARFKAHVQRSRQGVSLILDLIRQARLQPMALGSYASYLKSDRTFSFPESSHSLHVEHDIDQSEDDSSATQSDKWDGILLLTIAYAHQPSAPLAHLARSKTSLNEHGENLSVTWSPDGGRIVIQTTRPYLVLVTVEYLPEVTSYDAPVLAEGAQRSFSTGPGEGQPLQSLSLAFEGVIRAEGKVLSSPPAVQRIPWPAYDDSDSGDRSVKRSLMQYNTWILDDRELPWLVDPDVTVTKILQQVIGVETWLTSDGRAYFVRLQESRQLEGTTINGENYVNTSVDGRPDRESRSSTDSSSEHEYHWQGSCFHNYEVPRWVQKSRQFTHDGSGDKRPPYVEPRRATQVAVNARFSLIAVGTLSGAIEFTTFPTPGTPPKPRVVEVPNPHNRPPGEVLAMEWSSDGYVLAVGWQHGWAIISMGGRCLSSNFGVDENLDSESATSGRWKMFSHVGQEQAFSVKGGLLWFHHVLIAAVEVSKSYQIRLYSRDLELSNQNVLHREMVAFPVVILSLVDNSLLVYTADNMLSHYLIIPTSDSIKLHLCGSITFNGVIGAPSTVRVLSWMIPSAQKQFGDPADDLAVATVLLMVGESSSTTESPQHVKESVNIPLDFYPLSALMDKGIIIGAEPELITRSNLPFMMFRQATSSHLFLHHVLRYHLESVQVQEAVQLASHYQHLVFFAHALEILLHTVVESEVSAELASGELNKAALPAVVEFLDHFDVALDVVVGCARKTEVTRWKHIFNVVGNPKNLFETCLATGRLRTAGSYLLVLHNLEQLDENNDDVIRLLRSAIDTRDWQLCRELLRFLHSVDDTGQALRHALTETAIWSGRHYANIKHPPCCNDFILYFGIFPAFPSRLYRKVPSYRRPWHPDSVHIEQAFGSDRQALGIIIVKDLPDVYKSYRESLLKFAYKYAHLPEDVKERYTDCGSSYSFGWSHGKEIMNGKPDTLKGSYYANPIVDAPNVSAELKHQHQEYYRDNIWPDADERGIEGFEQSFKNLGRFVFKVGCELAAACQPFVSKHSADTTFSLTELIGQSQTTKARLLHYFPPNPEDVKDAEDEPVDSWCGFHIDNSLLTGLCSAMFLREDDNKDPVVVPSPSPQSGLYIRTRGGELTKVSIPEDCLAFQTGEALELVTGGKLRATPHCVRVGGRVERTSRETFALFMQPNTDQKVSATETFGQFTKRILAKHYGNNSM